MIREEIEFELSQIIDKSIVYLEILMDENGMDMLEMKLKDDTVLFIQNKKSKSSDDFRIYSDVELDKFKGAKIISFEIIENMDFVDIEKILIDSLIFNTDKGELELRFENEGHSSIGWALAAFLITLQSL